MANVSLNTVYIFYPKSDPKIEKIIDNFHYERKELESKYEILDIREIIVAISAEEFYDKDLLKLTFPKIFENINKYSFSEINYENKWTNNHKFYNFIVDELKECDFITLSSEPGYRYYNISYNAKSLCAGMSLDDLSTSKLLKPIFKNAWPTIFE